MIFSLVILKTLVCPSAFLQNRQTCRKAGRQEGRKAGRQEGRKAGRQEGRKVGRQEGRRHGGREAGRQTWRQADWHAQRQPDKQADSWADKQIIIAVECIDTFVSLNSKFCFSKLGWHFTPAQTNAIKLFWSMKI